MKFIRNYKTKEEFESDYYDNGGVEVVSITCELGTFTFDRVEYIESFGKNVYRWTNGEKTLDTGKRNPEVGDSAYNDDPDGDGIPFEPDDGFEEYEITSVEEVEHESRYFEPWVSLSPTAPGVIADGMRFEYIGEMELGQDT